jgi:hypothetical protein
VSLVQQKSQGSWIWSARADLSHLNRTEGHLPGGYRAEVSGFGDGLFGVYRFFNFSIGLSMP